MFIFKSAYLHIHDAYAFLGLKIGYVGGYAIARPVMAYLLFHMQTCGFGYEL